jgi:hypothetical protein
MIDVRFLQLGLAAAFVSGCGTIQYYPDLSAPEGDEAVDGEEVVEGGATAVTEDGDTFVVERVEPAYGTDLGGAEVALIGGPFDDDTEVWFGDVQAEIVSVDDDELVVLTPELAVGRVDVVVERDGAEAVLEEGFRVWEDASGLVGLTGTVAIVDLVGDYWAPTASDLAYASFALVEPVPYETWQEYTTAFNSCTLDHVAPQLQLLDAGPASLVGGSVEIDLEDADGWMEAEADVQPGEGYDLVAAESTSDTEAFTLDGLVRVPDGLQITGPNLDSTAPMAVPRQFDLRWDASQPGDYVAIVMEKAVYNPNTDSYVLEETLSCAVSDSGVFTIPGSMWADWSRDETIFVRVGRIRESNVVLPHNQAEVAVTGAFWVSGAVLADG